MAAQALVAVEASEEGQAEGERARGLRHRIEPIPQWLPPDHVAELVGALRDDDVPGNALSAISRLRGAGPEVLASLQEALLSADWQQRQLAAYLLALREDDQPTSALAAVLVEALRDDGLPQGPVRPTWQGRGDRANCLVNNRRVAVWQLTSDPLLFQLAEEELVAALDSDDGQQQATAAYVLACQGSWLDLPRTCDVLIEHLQDNHLQGDAVEGLVGLSCLGSAAVPHVQAALPGVDDQQRELLGHWLGHFVPTHPQARRLSPEQLGKYFPAGDPCLRAPG